MKRILIGTCFALPLLAPAISRAQAVQTPPATPVPAADSSSGDGGSSVMFRVGGIMMNGERNSDFNKSVQQGTGSVKGVEVILRGGGIGLSFRSLSGTFTATGSNVPDVISADANLLLGPPAFTISVGASRRALSSTLGTRTFDFGRAGLQMSFLIGGSGFRAQVGGWGYVPADPDMMKIGGEGEASLIYTFPVIPIYLQAGYRTEVFTSKTASSETPEEVRGLRIGGGIQFGGK